MEPAHHGRNIKSDPDLDPDIELVMIVYERRIAELDYREKNARFMRKRKLKGRVDALQAQGSANFPIEIEDHDKGDLIELKRERPSKEEFTLHDNHARLDLATITRYSLNKSLSSHSAETRRARNEDEVRPLEVVRPRNIQQNTPDTGTGVTSALLENAGSTLNLTFSSSVTPSPGPEKNHHLLPTSERRASPRRQAYSAINRNPALSSPRSSPPVERSPSFKESSIVKEFLPVELWRPAQKSAYTPPILVQGIAQAQEDPNPALLELELLPSQAHATKTSTSSSPIPETEDSDDGRPVEIQPHLCWTYKGEALDKFMFITIRLHGSKEKFRKLREDFEKIERGRTRLRKRKASAVEEAEDEIPASAAPSDRTSISSKRDHAETEKSPKKAHAESEKTKYAVSSKFQVIPAVPKPAHSKSNKRLLEKAAQHIRSIEPYLSPYGGVQDGR